VIETSIDGIEHFLASLEALGDQEKKLRAVREDLTKIEREARDERQAIDFDRYDRARRALSALNSAEAELPGFDRFTDDDLVAWRSLDTERARQEHTLREARATADTRQGELDEAHRTVERLRAELREADVIASRITGSGFLTRFREFSEQRAAAQRRTQRHRWLWPAGWVLTGTGALALTAGVFLRRIDVAAIGLLLIPGLGALSLAASFGTGTRKWQREAQRLLQDAKKLGISADTLDEAIDAAHGGSHQASTIQSLLESAEEEVERRERLLKERSDRVAELLSALSDVQQRISAIRDRTGLPGLADLESKVTERQELEGARDRAESELHKLLRESMRSEWTAAVEALAVPDPGRRPTQGRLEDIEKKRKAEADEVGQLQRATHSAVDTGLARIGYPNQAAARKALEELRREQQQRNEMREAALLALAAIQQAQGDLASHFEQALRDPKDGVSTMFRRITRNHWTGVRQSSDGRFEVVQTDGTGVPFEALSRGTQDQLFFAIRAVLAERILNGPAFFVWDDTFLTADPQRRRVLVEASVDLALRGWQILYLTVDPSLTELFEKVASAAGLSGFSQVSLPTADTPSPPIITVPTGGSAPVTRSSGA